MPRPAPVEEEVRRAAAASLRVVLPSLFAAFRARHDLELCESLPIVLLDEGNLPRDGRLRNLARGAGHVQHHIRAHGEIVAYARSRVEAGGSRLVSVGVSRERARGFEAAIDALDADARLREESDTYLLEVPSRRVIALWTEEPDGDVLSLVASDGLELAPGRVLETGSFLDRLRRLPPVGGVAP